MLRTLIAILLLSSGGALLAAHGTTQPAPTRGTPDRAARPCNCPRGFDGTAGNCVDINECATSNGGCAPGVTCVNSSGSWSCGDCQPGYAGSGSAGCVDINECAASNGGCDLAATCINQPGSFDCGPCPSGYTGSGSTACIDINECAVNNGSCNGTCVNTTGSFVCP